MEFAEMLPLTHSPLVSFYTSSLYRLITRETSSAPRSPSTVSSSKTLPTLITFIWRNGPLALRLYNGRTKQRKNSPFMVWSLQYIWWFINEVRRWRWKNFWAKYRPFRGWLMVYCHIYSIDLFKTRYAFLSQETISIVTGYLIPIIWNNCSF